MELLLSLIVARSIGPNQYGAYENARAWVGILGVFAALGLPQLIIREVSVYHSNQKYGKLRGLWRFSALTTLVISVVLAGLSALWGFQLYEGTLLRTLWIGLLAVPITAGLAIGQAMLRGLEHVLHSQVVKRLIQPGSFLILTFLLVFLTPQTLNSQVVIGLYIVSVVFGLASVFMWLYRRWPGTSTEVTPQYDTARWAKSAFPLLFIAGTQILIAKTDIVMLGAYKGGEASGIYAIATRGATLITFPLLAVNKPLAPRIAQLYQSQETKALQELIKGAARIGFFVAVPGVLMYAVMGDTILSVFGRSFRDGHYILLLLSTGHLLDVACGPVGLFLNMVERERLTAYAKGIGATSNISLNWLLIPTYGMYGACVASIVSLVGPNLYLLIESWRREGINTSIV
ncbi:O-antigen/teichoic acid export membrane protein [Salinibacter ruber]|nr:O-antigen/teichoic acid export membrane protein [Salinibacter ruber]